jgi:hypothetical protein
MLSIKDMVKDNQKAHFQYYFDGALWFKTEVGNFEFPVPVSDLGTASVKNEEKALLLMRYIRKHIDFIEKAKENN